LNFIRIYCLRHAALFLYMVLGLWLAHLLLLMFLWKLLHLYEDWLTRKKNDGADMMIRHNLLHIVWISILNFEF
jgi:hypothetical protein